MRRLIIIVCELEETSNFPQGEKTNLFDAPFYEHAHRKIMDAANKLELKVQFISADVFASKEQGIVISTMIETDDIVAVVSPFVFFASSKAVEEALIKVAEEKFAYSTIGSENDLYGVIGVGKMITPGQDITSCKAFLHIISGTGAVYTRTTLLEDEAASPLSRIEYFKKVENYRQEFLDYLVMSGVDIENRDGVTVAPNCVVRAGTKIFPNTQIYNKTLIKEKCTVGPNTVISHSQIGEDSVIENSKILDSVLGQNVKVESYSRIENNCQIENGVRIFSGCTVENSYIGLKSKIYPNSVLIETKAGENVTVGSGTVTVKPVSNKAESKTYQCRIGDYAIIGCNSTLIEPIEIGENGLVAAGSVITDTVPKNAFAIAREFQETKENRAKKRKRF